MAKKKKPPVNDEAELERAYAELTGYDITPKKKKGHPILIFLLILAFAIGGCTLGLPFLLDEAGPATPPVPSTEATTIPTEPTTLPTTPTTEPQPTSGDIRSGELDLSGMTEAELREALSTLHDAYRTTDMTVTLGTTILWLTPDDTNAGLDVDAAAAAILAAESGEFDLTPYVTLDTAYIQDMTRDWAERYSAAYTETTCSVTGKKPDLSTGKGDNQTLVITKGIPDRSLDTDSLYQAILDAYYGRVFSVTGAFSDGELEAFDLKSVYEYYAVSVKNAVMDSDFNVQSERWGYDFDLTAAQEALDAAEYGQTVTISFRKHAPSVTAEALSALLFRDILASYSSPYVDDDDRTVNLQLACKAINGVILNPGESLSYNKALGERTTARGYKPAASFLNGQVVKTVGGGICQVSSNLYYCALLADLDIVVRSNHSMTVDYVPLGMDAMVNWGTQDFKIRNNTNYPIRIIASVAGGNVNVSIEGTDEKDYYVRMEYEINATYPYETEYRWYDADNSEGYEDGDVLITPSTGYKITTYKCKYDKITGDLISRQQEDTSRYKARNAVIIRINDAAEETNP